MQTRQPAFAWPHPPAAARPPGAAPLIPCLIAPGPLEREGGQPAAHAALRVLLSAADLVVVDVETTGWLADDARITEIGAVRLSPDGRTSEFAALVNPGVPIPADVADLTGITDAMVCEAPAIGEVLPRFLEFAAGGIMVAHNAPFDIGFLTSACLACGIGWPPCVVIDTATLSRMLLHPEVVPDHKLATLAGHFGTQAGPCHRALADARTTAGVLAGLLPLLADWPDQARAGQARENAAAGKGYDVAATGARAPGVKEAAMVTAIVLIKADVARIPETAEAIARIEAVSEVYSVTGEFDLVAMVRVRDHDELGDVIPGTLNRVPGVTHTETHIAFRTYSRHDLDAAFSIGYPETA